MPSTNAAMCSGVHRVSRAPATIGEVRQDRHVAYGHDGRAAADARVGGEFRDRVESAPGLAHHGQACGIGDEAQVQQAVDDEGALVAGHRQKAGAVPGEALPVGLGRVLP